MVISHNCIYWTLHITLNNIIRTTLEIWYIQYKNKSHIHHQISDLYNKVILHMRPVRITLEIRYIQQDHNNTLPNIGPLQQGHYTHHIRGQSTHLPTDTTSISVGKFKCKDCKFPFIIAAKWEVTVNQELSWPLCKRIISGGKQRMAKLVHQGRH